MGADTFYDQRCGIKLIYYELLLSAALEIIGAKRQSEV